MDRERKITLWNQSAEEVTGYRSKEIVGHYCYDNILRHVDMRGTELCTNGCPLKKTIEDGESEEEIVKRADRMMYMSKTTGGNRVTTDG